MIIAIHSVFILKENILFLEEWIYYHMLLGFNKFYLYDNSKVMKKEEAWGRNNKHYVAGKINKYGVNYDEIVNLSETKMKSFIAQLCDKYKCVDIIEWSPKNNDGVITHSQVKAHNHCLQRLKKDGVDWCANIDMDEYIVIKDFDNIGKYISSLPQKINNVKLGQIRFDSRFNNLDKLVTDIIDADIKDIHISHSPKNIYKVQNTIKTSIHSVTNNSGSEYKPLLKEICFNHYNSNKANYKCINNIHNNIKSKLSEYSFIKLI